jgi:hypothetical protein
VIWAQLEKHLESYSQSSWQLAGQESEDAASLADWLDLGLALLDSIRRMEQRHDAQARGGQTPLDKADLERIHRLYMQWYAPCDHLLKLIEQHEGQGSPVENAEQFREACRATYIPGLEPDALARAEEQFRNGEGIPLRDVVNELRGRAVE